jgi:cytosine/adenosine deaminase-related metal-dependent hydrolase
MADRLSRRHFLGGAAMLAFGCRLGGTRLLAQSPPKTVTAVEDLVLVNGRIHTMNANIQVVSQALIRNGRFAAVGNDVSPPAGRVRRVDLKGKTVIPGIIDAHNHIVLVGNRPGWHTPLEHAFSIPDALWRHRGQQMVHLGGRHRLR